MQHTGLDLWQSFLRLTPILGDNGPSNLFRQPLSQGTKLVIFSRRTIHIKCIYKNLNKIICGCLNSIEWKPQFVGKSNRLLTHRLRFPPIRIPLETTTTLPSRLLLPTKEICNRSSNIPLIQLKCL